MRQVSEAVRRIRQVSRSRGQDTSSLANDFVWNTPLSGHAQEDRNSPAYDPEQKSPPKLKSLYWRPLLAHLCNPSFTECVK